MRKKNIFTLLVLFLALNVVAIMVRRRHDAEWNDDVRARETGELRAGFRAGHMATFHDYYSLIGALAKSGFWTKSLPLAEAQKETVIKLDGLLWDADANSCRAVADYLDGNPADYKQYVARAKKRSATTILRAQRMVAVGLLTETQSAFVTQRYLSSQREAHSLGDTNVQQLLAITNGQKEKLAELWKAARDREAHLNLFSVNPEEQKENSAKMAANNQMTDAAAAQILTQAQREQWGRLTAAQALSAEPPDLRALTDAKAATSELRTLSSTFRLIDSDAGLLALSPEQKRLLRDLEEVTCQGLLWIGLENSNTSGKRRAEFLELSEKIALEGVLTQRQEDQVLVGLRKH